MIDVKKLITGFLILAAVASVSAIALSTFGGSLNKNTAIKNAQTATINPPSVSPFGANAFLGSPLTAGTSTFDVSSSDATTLTGTLASAFLNGVITANPDGPQSDASGSPSFAAPDQQSIASALINHEEFKNLQIPNWDLTVAEQKLALTKSTSSQDIADYSNALNDLFNKYFVNTNVQGMLGASNADPSNLSFISTQVSGALQEISGLHTPAALNDFQKSLVKVLVYEKSALALAMNAQDDPMKTSLVFQAEQNKYQAAADDFGSQFQKAQSLKSFSFGAGMQKEEDHGVFATIRGMLGIKTAHAQWIVFDPTQFARTIWQWVQMIILQILKNTLINQIQNRVLTWVQGNGVPRFVQQWATTFTNSLNAAANAAIAKSSAGLYPGFQPSVRSTLSQYYNQLGVAVTTPLENIVGNNLQGFSDNFSQGGWDAYGASILPSGNYYGSEYLTAQTAQHIGALQQQATQAQHIASQGTTGDMVCADGSNPQTGTHLICIDPNGFPVTSANGTCDPGYFPAQVPNAGSCADGSEPTKTSPGIVTSQGLASAIESPVHLIVNADNIVDLAFTMANSLLNNLTQKAITAGTSAINGGLQGTGGGGASPTPIPTAPLSCNTPFTNVTLTNGLATTVYNANGGQAVNGIPPTYTWTAPGATTVSSAAGISITVTYSIPGTYTATVTASSGGTSNCTITVQ